MDRQGPIVSGPSSQGDGEIENLHQRFPALRTIEGNGRHRLQARRSVARLAPKSGVGVEIGVYTGLFSVHLHEITQPRQLYLVDPWEKLHGQTYPNWGEYSSNLHLPTEAARLAATARARHLAPGSTVVVDFFETWIPEQAGLRFDWVYLDASHKKSAVLASLDLIRERLNPGGVIMGDDCWVHRGGRVSEVFQALDAFTSDNAYKLIHLDAHGQWAIMRTRDFFGENTSANLVTNQSL